MKRAFIVLLLFFALLCAIAIQHTITLPPFSPGKMLGLIPVNDMVFALPAAIFAAGTIVAAMGIGAELWRSLLPICGAAWVPTHRFSRLADAGLWCGWILAGTCFAAQNYIFPWLAANAPNALYTAENYRIWLLIGFGTMLAARLFNTYLPRQKGLLPTLMCAAVALICGQCWWNGLPIDFVTAALLLPLGVILCSHSAQQGEADAPFIWLCIAALAFCLYATGFSQLIINYPTGPTALSPHTLYLKFAANTLWVAALVTLLIPPMRSNTIALRIVGGISLAAVIIYNAEAIFAPIYAWCNGLFPSAAAMVTYLLTLSILSALAVLRYVSATQNKKI